MSCTGMTSSKKKDGAWPVRRSRARTRTRTQHSINNIRCYDVIAIKIQQYNIRGAGGWKEVIIRSRAGSSDLLDLCAFMNCMHERTCLITFFAFQNLAQLSQLSSARSRLAIFFFGPSWWGQRSSALIFNSLRLLQDYFPMYKYTCTLLLSHNLCCVVFWLDYTRKPKGGIVV